MDFSSLVRPNPSRVRNDHQQLRNTKLKFAYLTLFTEIYTKTLFCGLCVLLGQMCVLSVSA